MSGFKLPDIEDVYTPDEIREIQIRTGWKKHLASWAHSQRMLEACRKASEARYQEYIKELASKEPKLTDN